MTTDIDAATATLASYMAARFPQAIDWQVDEIDGENVVVAFVGRSVTIDYSEEDGGPFTHTRYQEVFPTATLLANARAFAAFSQDA